MQKGDKVVHHMFGEGIVLNVFNDYADVDFLHFGKKSILLESLKLVSEIEYKSEDETIAYSKLLYIAIGIFTDKKKEWMYLKDFKPLLFYKTAMNFSDNQLVKELDVVQDIVFRNRLFPLYRKASEDSVRYISPEIEEKTESEINIKSIDDEVNDFCFACEKLKITDSTLAFFVRGLINFTKKQDKTEVSTYYLANFIFNQYLYQISIGPLFNIINLDNPPFYEEIDLLYQKNRITESKEIVIRRIEEHIQNHFMNQFLICKNKRMSFYSVKKNKILFNSGVLLGIAKKANSLDKQIINKLCYFLTMLNEKHFTVSAYCSDLKHGEDLKGGFIKKFQFNTNLEKMKKELQKDFYTRQEFKDLMAKYKIPVTKENFKQCLDRVDYRLKTKTIILKNTYPTLKAYFKEKIPHEDIYRYSNPNNLDEYDNIIKALNEELYLLEVENGVYLTFYNLEKNGITENAIKRFQNKVKELGRKCVFFSLDEIKNEFSKDPIINFCALDDNQLRQFVESVDAVKKLSFDSGDYLFYCGEEKAKGALLVFIMGNSNSMSVYEIEDFVDDKFGVKYLESDVQNDVRFTSFYYSEEMEKIYKSKLLYLKEVYGE